jgi:hypothetical protein
MHRLLPTVRIFRQRNRQVFVTSPVLPFNFKDAFTHTLKISGVNKLDAMRLEVFTGGDNEECRLLGYEAV